MTEEREKIEIRLFDPLEWRFYKAIRLKALQTDPGVFGSNHLKESARADDEWKSALSDSGLGVFGVFHYGDIIGMTGIYVDKDDSTRAGLWGSWLEPKWRGKGISEVMYKARIEWARQHPEVTCIRVSHRKSNTASKMANRKHGFEFTHEGERTWPDGVTEAEVFYELKVKD